MRRASRGPASRSCAPVPCTPRSGRPEGRVLRCGPDPSTLRPRGRERDAPRIRRAIGRAPSRPAGRQGAGRRRAAAPRRTAGSAGSRRTSGSPRRRLGGNLSGRRPAPATRWSGPSAKTASGSPAPRPATITPRGDSSRPLNRSSPNLVPVVRTPPLMCQASSSARGGGSGPASPSSGSRNARLRWTGPGIPASPWPSASATERDASDLQVDAVTSSATPGSLNQRTARPKR